MKTAPNPHGSLECRYPPSPACACEVCRAYCARPGWWTVTQAEAALRAGLGARMMLEAAPGFAYGVLAPAFRGCERRFALQVFAGNGCTFLAGGLCALHSTDLLPLECAFCHHQRAGLGARCHADIALDWRGAAGRRLVQQWSSQYLIAPFATRRG